jgi:hypothetical protein
MEYCDSPYRRASNVDAHAMSTERYVHVGLPMLRGAAVCHAAHAGCVPAVGGGKMKDARSGLMHALSELTV